MESCCRDVGVAFKIWDMDKGTNCRPPHLHVFIYLKIWFTFFHTVNTFPSKFCTCHGHPKHVQNNEQNVWCHVGRFTFNLDDSGADRCSMAQWLSPCRINYIPNWLTDLQLPAQSAIVCIHTFNVLKILTIINTTTSPYYHYYYQHCY